ncbi:hypothetical protein GF406_15595 [candidate division KSB1 bacterium]|nr:hypothetical protein [candidate division KSB1 bacterium]
MNDLNDKLFWVMIMIAIWGSQQSLAAGITRSSGVGFRMSYWNQFDQPTQVQTSITGEQTVRVNGLGGDLFFFTRLYDSWFFELSIGGVSNVEVLTQNYVSEKARIDAVIPLLLGVRYDFMSSLWSASVNPYVSAGTGAYMWTSNQIQNSSGVQETVNIESEFKTGLFLGAGINLALNSRIVLNFDVKRHYSETRFNDNSNGFAFTIGACFMWGKQREFFQIKDIKWIVQDIYPAYYQFYNTYPIALVTIENRVGQDIEVNITCDVSQFSERPRETGFVRIPGGQTQDIPVTVYWNRDLQNVQDRETAIVDLQIHARTGQEMRRHMSSELVIHSRNAWNGDTDKLGFFLTPEDQTIRQLSRQVNVEDSTAAVRFERAKALFELLQAQQIQYHPDPNIPFYQDDRVQYAAETLSLGQGDCDDLTVLYASLLESVGIHTAFVDVQDPQKELAHLYLLFDTGLAPEQGALISSNEKRYIVRQNDHGRSTLWIPVETTLIGQSFESAWTQGAMQYLQEAVLRQGLAERWVRIIEN